MNSNLCWSLLTVSTLILLNASIHGESQTVSANQSAEFVVNSNRGSHPEKTRSITIRSILDAPPAERQRLFANFTKQRPTAYNTVTPAVNRPPVTPGNEHGNRPVVPPGIRNYATP